MPSRLARRRGQVQDAGTRFFSRFDHQTAVAIVLATDVHAILPPLVITSAMARAPTADHKHDAIPVVEFIKVDEDETTSLVGVSDKNARTYGCACANTGREGMY